MSERFVVDWILCDGYGLCGDFAPDLIALDEWRYPMILPGPIPRSRLHDAQRAVDCCPMKALRLVAEDHDGRAARSGPASSRDPSLTRPGGSTRR